MNLKTKMIAIVSIYLIFFTIFSSVIVQNENIMIEAKSKKESAMDIVKDVFELNIITTDFIIARNIRSFEQWQSKYVSLGNIIKIHLQDQNGHVGHGHTNEDFKLLSSLYENHQDIGEIFFKIQGNNASSAGIDLLGRQLEMKSQLMVSDAFKIVNNAEREYHESQQLFIFLIVLLIISIFLLIIIIYFLIDRLVIKPINILKNGADHIGKGNLDYRINISNEDEIGDLADSFNIMTNNIRVSQNEIIESEKFLQSMMDSVSDVFYVFDVNGQFLLWNKSFENVSGYSKDEIKKMKPTEFFTEGESGKVSKAIKDAVENGSSSVEADFVSKNGNKTPMLFSGSLSKNQNNQAVVVGTGKDVSELRKIQKEIMVFKKFVENSSQGFGMATMDNKIVYINKALMNFLDIKNSENVISKSFAQFYPNEMQHTLEQEVIPSLNNEGTWTGELCLKSSDNTCIPTIESFFLLKNEDGKPLYICDVISDITDIKKAEEKLRKSEEKFKAISDFTIDLEWWIDTNGKLIWANKTSKKFTGYSPEETYEMSCKDFFIKDQQSEFLSLLNKGLNEKTIINDVEFKLEKRDGEQIDVAISWQPIYNYDNEWMGLRASLRDISDRKKAEEKIKELNQELEEKVDKRTKELQNALYDLQKESEKRKLSEMKRIQTEKMATIGTLSAGVAHELNNPLMGILNYIEYAKNHISDKKLSDILKDAEKEVKRCTSIVKNLLTFSRTSKEGKEPLSDVDLESIVDRVLNLLSYQLNDITVTKNIEENVSEVRVMQNKIQQVVLNIIDNAIDVLHDKDNEDKRIDIDICEEDENINFSITNNGPPIPVREKDKIFDPFYTTKDVGEGTGLGLSICNNIIKQHHGTLSVENWKGKGTSFIIKLPLRKEKIRRKK